MPQMLDRAARARLRTLTKSNSDHVASHLVMAGRLVDVDPELAYEHARTAVRHAGRVDIAREALALTAYATGRYAEALREVRTVRRLSGIDAHPAIEADCERGLGRPERALTVIAEAKERRLSVEEVVELALVESGARADLGEHDAALLVVDKLLPAVRDPESRYRLLHVRADRLEALDRLEEAAAVRESVGELEPDPVVVTDLLGDEEPETADVDPGGSGEAAETETEGAPAPAEPTAEPSAEGEVDGLPDAHGDGDAAGEDDAEADAAMDADGEADAASDTGAEPDGATQDMTEPATLPGEEAAASTAADTARPTVPEPAPDSASTPEPAPASAAEPAGGPEPEQEQLDLFADTDLEDRP